MVGVAAVQFLSLVNLLGAAAACAVAAWGVAPARSVRLLKRIRFLLLAIIVFFAGFTPGEAIIVAWPSVSPSREGVFFAIEHAARLVAVVLSVAMLLECLSAQRIVSGLYALLRPFEVVGLPAASLAVRLMLVLRYVESGSTKGWRHWLETDDEGPAASIVVLRESFGGVELSVLLAAVAAIGVWVIAQ